jgi:hypothetical protein
MGHLEVAVEVVDAAVHGGEDAAHARNVLISSETVKRSQAMTPMPPGVLVQSTRERVAPSLWADERLYDGS